MRHNLSALPVNHRLSHVYAVPVVLQLIKVGEESSGLRQTAATPMPEDGGQKRSKGGCVGAGAGVLSLRPVFF